MGVKKPLVNYSGKVKELQSGDTIGSTLGNLQVVVTDTTLSANYGVVFVRQLNITGTAKFTNQGVLRIIN